MNISSVIPDLEKINPEVIAFDIFDTVIHRTVSPNHVHRMWAKELIDYYDLNMTIRQLVSLKMNARRFAKLNNMKNGLDRECSYDQMTKRIYKALRIQEPYDIFNDRCIKFEFDIEKKIGYINEDFLNVYFEVVKMGKTVIFISDFYLPGRVLKNLLCSKGIDVKEQQIFSSSDFCRTKITGKLYQCVLEKLKIIPNKVLMIGDSKISDYENARSNGFNAYHIDSSQHTDMYKNFDEKFNKNAASLDLLFKEKWIQSRQIPFSHVGFCMFAFSDNLYKMLIKHNRKNIFFLSREGELFKRMFDIYQDIIIKNQNERINTHYLKVSRHSTLIASIFEVKKDNFQEIYKNYPDITLETFLKNLGLQDDNDIISEFHDNIKSKEVISDFKNSSVYDKLLSSEIFKEKCISRAKRQRELFIKYLDSFEVDYRSDGFCVVDIGYSGTTQENLKKIFSNEVRVCGYYMFSYANPRTISSMNQKFGVLYDKNVSHLKKDYFAYNSAVLEMISLASHGSINDYVVENERVIPTYNYMESEEIAYREIIIHVQKNIEYAMRKICLVYSETIFVKNDYYKRFLKQYRRFIFNPTSEEMHMYAEIPFVDNFAAYVTYDKSTIKKQSALKNIIKLILSSGRLIRQQNTHWVAIALNRLGLKSFNLLLYIYAPLAVFIFDFLEMLEKKRKGVS